MKAIVQTRYGSPSDVLHLREVDKPVVGDDEVLVRVHAASVHADVWVVVTGHPYLMRLMFGGLRKPKHTIPGTDMAGTVETVGKDVTRFEPGNEVFGESNKGFQWLNGGAYAEYVAVPEHALALKPGNVTFEQAASVPTSGYIALMNLQEGGQLQPGQRVMINGAGGGVGSIAVQLAKAYGVHVTAVDNTEKLEMVRSLGADEVIDYTHEDVTQRDEHYDFILDVASTLSLSDWKRLLTSAGTYVQIGHNHYGKGGSRTFGTLLPFFGLMVRSPFDPQLPNPRFSLPSRQEVMATLKDFLEAGQLTPIIDRTYPLDKVPEALRYLQEGNNLGKIIITP